MQDRASTSGQPHVTADYVLMLQARSGDQCAGVKFHAHFEAGADLVPDPQGDLIFTWGQ
jgi:hypothetical protein